MAAGNWTSWTDAVWCCIELMDITVGSTFTLKEIFEAEHVLKRIYPKNNRIREKIRQQLQIMRDYDKLEFVNDNGVYRRIS
jgi:type II restriction enzyme